jgi:hypothetical protein
MAFFPKRMERQDFTSERYNRCCESKLPSGREEVFLEPGKTCTLGTLCCINFTMFVTHITNRWLDEPPHLTCCSFNLSIVCTFFGLRALSSLRLWHIGAAYLPLRHICDWMTSNSSEHMWRIWMLSRRLSRDCPSRSGWNTKKVAAGSNGWRRSSASGWNPRQRLHNY